MTGAIFLARGAGIAEVRAKPQLCPTNIGGQSQGTLVSLGIAAQMMWLFLYER
jgi:hypothetical protein